LINGAAHTISTDGQYMSHYTAVDGHLGVEGEGAQLPWAGQAYSVKRFGVTITNCESEPVQTPGCIQGHGALLV